MDDQIFDSGSGLTEYDRLMAKLGAVVLSHNALADENALADVFTNAPLGTKVVSTPERPMQDNTQIERSFAGKRGRIALEESSNVDAAGGPAPAQDWKPASLSPELDKSTNTTDTLRAARASVMAAYGVPLPARWSMKT